MLELLEMCSVSKANTTGWEKMLNLLVVVDNETLCWLLNNLDYQLDSYRTVASELWMRCLK